MRDRRPGTIDSSRIVSKVRRRMQIDLYKYIYIYICIIQPYSAPFFKEKPLTLSLSSLICVVVSLSCQAALKVAEVPYPVKQAGVPPCTMGLSSNGTSNIRNSWSSYPSSLVALLENLPSPFQASEVEYKHVWLGKRTSGWALMAKEIKRAIMFKVFEIKGNHMSCLCCLSLCI